MDSVDSVVPDIWSPVGIEGGVVSGDISVSPTIGEEASLSLEDASNAETLIE